MSTAGAATTGRGPSPRAAYSRWMDACTAAGWRPAAAAIQVPVWDALGGVTAAPVHARWSFPRSACAAMDGIAVRADAVTFQAGAPDPWRLPPGSFTWVDTGDPMPSGMDTVVERERVVFGADGSAQITGPAPQGLHVRSEGEDFQGGQLLIPAGHRLRPADLAAAAAAGHSTVEIARGPVAAIIPTGDEIRPIGAVLGPGDITDSNSLMLALRARETGARDLVTDVQPDDQDAIAAAIGRAALAADIMLVIAGSSAGRGDHTAAAIARAGGLAVNGVAVRPGHPVLLGYARPGPGRDGATVPVIGVPGYPLAAAVIFELFAVPVLAALQGWEAPDRPSQRAELACDWASPPDVEDWVPVSLAPAGTPAEGLAVATPGRRGAGSTSRLMHADAWWPIPIGQGKFARGEHIDVLPISGAPS